VGTRFGTEKREKRKPRHRSRLQGEGLHEVKKEKGKAKKGEEFYVFHLGIKKGGRARLEGTSVTGL